MKVKVNIQKEVELITLMVKAEVRYWEDSKINGKDDTTLGDNVPCRNGGFWCPIIDIDSGMILNWRKGVVAEIHYKVADGCNYKLLDIKGNTILDIEDCYVPHTLSPKENGYGDYIKMDIDKDGKIANWKFKIEDFDGLENN